MTSTITKIRKSNNPYIEEVSAIFIDTIPPGLDLVRAESRCYLYETTMVRDGATQVRMMVTKMVCKETKIEFRVNGDLRSLPTELAKGDKISLVIVSPPASLRRVMVKLCGMEIPFVID